MKFILLINVIMPTIAGILTFINRIICIFTSKGFKQKKKILIILYFSFREQFKSDELGMNKFYIQNFFHAQLN